LHQHRLDAEEQHEVSFGLTASTSKAATAVAAFFVCFYALNPCSSLTALETDSLPQLSLYTYDCTRKIVVRTMQTTVAGAQYDDFQPLCER
ncbi:MAG: hypothetical protein MUF11_14740, partial [Beijerinckiaceae bacterium]|nr:hypothetical protein [Beijerinckiaceae bacterium]